jgi:hypothetical protein
MTRRTLHAFLGATLLLVALAPFCPAKAPDLPKNDKITVEPQVPATASDAPTCPFFREQHADRHAPTCADEEGGRDVLDNLRRLEMAAELTQKAKEFARGGDINTALQCLEAVRELCPGSSYDGKIIEAMVEIIANSCRGPLCCEKPAVDAAHDAAPADWQGAWKWLEGHIEDLELQGIFLLGKTIGCYLINVYSPCANPSCAGLIDSSEDLKEIEAEWARNWANLHENMTPEELHAQVMGEEIPKKAPAVAEVKPQECSPTSCPKCEQMHANRPGVRGHGKTGCGSSNKIGPMTLSPTPGREGEASVRKKLATPVSVNFKDVPLQQVLDDLADANHINIVVDAPALQEAGITLDSRVSVWLDSVPLKKALKVILNQVHLTYVVGDEALQITTAIRKKLAAPVSLNFRDVPLQQVLDDLADTNHINIVLDTPAIQQLGISMDSTVSMRLDSVPLKSALNLILNQVHLIYVVCNEALQVTPELQGGHGGEGKK